MQRSCHETIFPAGPALILSLSLLFSGCQSKPAPSAPPEPTAPPVSASPEIIPQPTPEVTEPPRS